MTSNEIILQNAEDKTFFSTIRDFQSTDLEEINTLAFLESARGLVALVDIFGKIFTPVKYDMNGNIEKLNRKYQEDPEKYTNLQAMLLAEREQGTNTATDALMWLRRALQFFHKFFDSVVVESRFETKSDNMSRILKMSYAETLQRYHGWMAQRLFNLLCRTCPSRTDLIAKMSMSKTIKEEILMQDIESFNERLNLCLVELVKFYETNGLENHGRV